MTILFALRRVNETEVADQKAQELYEEEANLGLFGKIKRNLI
ncbi:MAG: hypothetical protein U9O91_06460 [Candidatus Caldatribacteriota bacterium]|nr:hypothetical protein [Candidatus Caldatribacteriota bacterium]